VFESTSAQRGESTASLRRGASFVASVPIKSPCCFWDAAHEAMHSASASQGCVGGRAASVSAPARTSSMVRDGSRSHSASERSSFGGLSAAAAARSSCQRIFATVFRLLLYGAFALLLLQRYCHAACRVCCLLAPALQQHTLAGLEVAFLAKLDSRTFSQGI
jgi:hypothetical protein